MPKVSRVGKFRKTAAKEQHQNRKAKEGDKKNKSDEQSLSRGQRKRQAKRDQYLKRQELVLSTLHLKHEEEQKRKIDGLDALKEALKATQKSTLDDTKPAENATISNALNCNKSKKELTAREVTRLELVLEHPAFQNNPIATLQEHLRNSIPSKANQDSTTRNRMTKKKKKPKQNKRRR